MDQGIVGRAVVAEIAAIARTAISHYQNCNQPLSRKYRFSDSWLLFLFWAGYFGITGKGRSCSASQKKTSLLPIGCFSYAVVPAPWHFLYFLPEPQGHGSFLPTLACPRTTCCGALAPFDPAIRACSSSFFLRRWNCASRSSIDVEALFRGGGAGTGCWSPSVGSAANGCGADPSTICMWNR